MKDTHERLSVALFALIFGTALGGIVAGVVWPWFGPNLVHPCPMPTTAGVWAYALLWGFGAFAKGLNK